MDKQDEILSTVVELKTDMKWLKETLTGHIADDEKVEVRLRKVERKQSWFTGGLAAVTVLFAVILRYFQIKQ